MRRTLALLAAATCLFSATGAFAADAVDAAELWKKKCAQCHGPDGKADTKMGKKYKTPDMTTPEWQKKNTDEDIRNVILNGGKTKMPPWKDKLSPAEIDAMVKYVRTLKP